MMLKGIASNQVVIIIGAILLLPGFLIVITLLYQSFEALAQVNPHVAMVFDSVNAVVKAVTGYAMDEDGKARYGDFATRYMAVVVALTFIGGLIGYRFLVSAQSKVQTIEFITRQVHDRDLIDMFSELRNVRNRYGENITYEKVYKDYLAYQEMVSDHGELKNRKHAYDLIIHVLNYYETWGIGIENDALDNKILCEWWRSSLVKDFIRLYPFILGYRDEKNIADTFENAEQLARRWADKEEANRLAEIKRLYEKTKLAKESASQLRRSSFPFSSNKRSQKPRPAAAVRAA